MKKRKKKAFRSSPSAGMSRLGDLLPQLVVKFGIQKKRDIEQLAEAWKKTVGEPYDAVSRVVGLNRGVLEISVPHNAFVQELSFRQAELLTAMRTAVPDEKINKIKFVVR